ncbi:hypothetical protein [Methylocapsa aurea]|uniref:hypothetical protein n=1 Tax=Methylocapsa aurea TaxID=663610 RepID=UPI00068C0908|nr:hypothetical protein [Methylocapsa aurea]
MADYYPLLAKAVAGLPNSTPESRHAIYERARKALFGQLRNLDPPIPESDIEREGQALEAAVVQLEAEFAATTEAGIAAEPPPPQEPMPPPAGATSSSDSSEPIGPAPVAQEPSQPKTADALPVSAPAPKTVRPSLLLRAQRDGPAPPMPGSKATDEANGGAPGAAPPFGPRRSLKNLSRNDVAAKASEAEGLGAPGLGAAGISSPDSFASDPFAQEAVPQGPVILDGGTPSVAQTTDAWAQVPEEQSAASGETRDSAVKSRRDAQRPLAPQPAREAVAPKRLWIVGVVVGLLVMLVAVAAFQFRDRPEDLARLQAPLAPAAPEAAPNGKIVERIGVGSSAAEPSSTPAAEAGSEANRMAVARSGAERGTEPGNPPISTALRAALLVAAPEEQSKVKTFLGSVVWHVDNVSNGPGEALSMAVRAEIEIPEEKLQTVVMLQKNLDSTLPASHTMNVRFVVPPGGPLGNIQQINVPQMRREDTATGSALSGIPVPIMENSFLVGLSRGSAEATNLDLLRSREWIDVPMVLSDGRIAKLTFEKGPPGQRAFDDALASWQAQ